MSTIKCIVCVCVYVHGNHLHVQQNATWLVYVHALVCAAAFAFIDPGHDHANKCHDDDDDNNSEWKYWE